MMSKLIKSFGLAAAFVALAMSLAEAQGSGTSREQRACNRDVSRICRKVMNDGDMAVFQCLKANRARLSKACGAVIDSH